MSGRRPHLIGIAGCSGAGKTTVARGLAHRLPGGGVVLPLDAYYRDLVPAGQVPIVTNFDEPQAFDVALLLRHLRSLREGHPVDRPVYDFVRHRRQDETIHLRPRGFVIAEGLFALHWPAARALYHSQVFLTAHNRLRLSRRLTRDTTERGRDAISVRRQWRDTVAPMSTRYVEPTQRFADAVIDADDSVDRVVSALIERFGW